MLYDEEKKEIMYFYYVDDKYSANVYTHRHTHTHTYVNVIIELSQ